MGKLKISLIINMISLLMLSGTVYGQQSSSNSLFRRATEHSNIRGQMSGGGGGGGGAAAVIWAAIAAAVVVPLKV